MHVQYAIQDKEKQFYIIQSLYCTCEVNNMVYILPCRKGWTVSSSYTNWLDGESTFEHDWQLVLEFLQLQIFLKFPSNLLFLASQAQLGTSRLLLQSMEFLAFNRNTNHHIIRAINFCIRVGRENQRERVMRQKGIILEIIARN